MKRFTFYLLIIIILMGCSTKNKNISASQKVIRMDCILFDALYSNNKEKLFSILQDYPEETRLLMQGITGRCSTQQEAHDILFSYFNEPNLHHLYKDVQDKFSDYPFNKTLHKTLSILQEVFPEEPIPQFTTHVSGLKQKILVGNSIISVSLDYYLGENYEFYQAYFYPYQIQKMIPEKIFPDWVRAFLEITFPKNNKPSFLSYLIQAGKIEYTIQKLFPKHKEHILIGYTKKELQWCEHHLTELWEQIVSRNILFSSDLEISAPFFREKPYHTLLPEEAPGNIGAWLGLQIIKKYVRKQRLSIHDLWFSANTPEEILRLSEFNPI